MRWKLHQKGIQQWGMKMKIWLKQGEMVRKFIAESNTLYIPPILIRFFFIILKNHNSYIYLCLECARISFETFLSHLDINAWIYDFFLYLYKCRIIKITKLLLILNYLKEAKKFKALLPSTWKSNLTRKVIFWKFQIRKPAAVKI